MTQGKPIVGYVRKSPAGKKKDFGTGLGRESQHEALNGYAAQSGGRILKIYEESESGKIADRPELKKAICHAKRSGATLVIAKLDRLARNVAFVANLMESGVDFACCDNPHANPLTIHILAAVAEDEAKRISTRTKEALAAAKRRGVKLGAARPECRNLSKEARERGVEAAAEARKRKADEAYGDLREPLLAMKAEGLSLRAMADRLNQDGGGGTRRGKRWTSTQVARVLRRLGIIE